MLQRSFRFASIVLFLTVIVGFANAATTTERFNQLSQDILEALQSFYPVRATQMGIHAYDHRLADYSSKSVREMIKKLKGFEKQLDRIRVSELTPSDQVDLKLIKSNVQTTLLDLDKIKWHESSPQLYVDQAVDGLYSLMISQHAPVKEKLFSILHRMQAVPELFATARKNIRKPPEVWIELANQSLESAIDFYREVGSELMNQFPDRADEILKASTQAREAMNDFLVFLASVERGPDKAFSIGKENFDYKLAHEYFLPFGSDSLLTLGESLLQEARQAYTEFEEYVESQRQNGLDSVFVPSCVSRQDILDYYNWEVDQERLFLESHDIITVPETIAPISVVETPDYLRSMVPGIAYQPAGPFDKIQQAFFYVRPVPEDLDRKEIEARYRYVHRRGFKGSVVHEAYPGHHLQMQIAGMNASAIRKWQQNPMMVEGWALYCEEMMYKAGLYGEEDPAMWLAILGGIRFRAARIVADVKLHTGQFTYDECTNWMIEVLEADTESSRDYLRRSVRKYTLTPTVWMSYLMGKREIERLYEAAEAAAGPDFVDADFYDTMLSEGSIPPTLLWQIMGLKPIEP
jgi:uncharacterized protein (DUF885 family)